MVIAIHTLATSLLLKWLHCFYWPRLLAADCRLRTKQAERVCQLKTVLPLETCIKSNESLPMLSVQDGMHASYFWRLLLLVLLCMGWMQWESNSFLQSRWYKPPNNQVLGFVFKTINCTLFCAYTIVPSNVPFPDCKSDMFNFWTSMPPEETVICNRMKSKWTKSKWMKSKTRNSPQSHSCM